jgi:hypothetical protein
MWACFQSGGRRPRLYVLFPALAIIGAFSFFTSINIGIRYILPAFPFLFLLAGAYFTRERMGRPRLAAGVLLLALYAGSQISAYPDYLAYFNLFGGGPRKNRHLLGDSNIDWGQDLPGLKRFMEDGKIETISLAYFGRVDPEIYGISHRPFVGKRLAPGYTAVSVNYVQGRPYDLRAGSRYLPVPMHQYRFLYKRKPLARIGNSILVYKR